MSFTDVKNIYISISICVCIYNRKLIQRHFRATVYRFQAAAVEPKDFATSATPMRLPLSLQITATAVSSTEHYLAFGSKMKRGAKLYDYFTYLTSGVSHLWPRVLFSRRKYRSCFYATVFFSDLVHSRGRIMTGEGHTRSLQREYTHGGDATSRPVALGTLSCKTKTWK